MADVESEWRWERDAAKNGWQMPTASWFARLWGVRHVRAIKQIWRVEGHRADCARMGMVCHSSFDDWVIYGIATGREVSNGRLF